METVYLAVYKHFMEAIDGIDNGACPRLNLKSATRLAAEPVPGRVQALLEAINFYRRSYKCLPAFAASQLTTDVVAPSGSGAIMFDIPAAHPGDMVPPAADCSCNVWTN